MLLVKRMQSLGIPDSRIQDAIWVLDKYPVFTNQARKYGFKNIITADFLAWDSKGMKFDLVLGNPPFQKRGWKNFLEKMSQVSADYVCIICPDPTKNDSSFGSEIRKILLDAGVYQKQECTNYFPGIESGEISYFLCSKNNKSNFLFEEDSIYISIRNKVSPNGSFVLRGSQNSITAETSLLPDNEYRFLGIFSASKTGLDMRYMKDVDYKISKKHREKLNGPFFIINRFFGKNVDDPVFLIDEIRDIFIGSNVMVIKSSNGDTVEGFQSVYGSKIYRFFIQKLRGKSFDITQSNLSSLPKLDLTRTWTDQELYEHFGLTEEEIEYIDSNIDTQRGRKHAEETER